LKVTKATRLIRFLDEKLQAARPTFPRIVGSGKVVNRIDGRIDIHDLKAEGGRPSRPTPLRDGLTALVTPDRQQEAVPKTLAQQSIESRDQAT
jgi:hypothetical protein